MEKGHTYLNQFNNSWYKPGASFITQSLWFVIHGLFFSSWLPGSGWRRLLLKLFGAKVGKDVIIKPSAKIKYPWNLEIGNYTWIGENVWIDCLGKVSIGEHCCLSQGALLLCGNHNYKKSSFDLMVGDIALENGVWIGAKSLVTGGVVCATESILTAGSMTSKNLEAYTVYSGNPAIKIRERIIET